MSKAALYMSKGARTDHVFACPVWIRSCCPAIKFYRRFNSSFKSLRRLIPSIHAPLEQKIVREILFRRRSTPTSLSLATLRLRAMMDF